MPLPPLTNPTSLWQRFRGMSLGLLVIPLIMGTVLVINAFQMLSVLLIVVSRRAASGFNRWLVGSWVALWTVAGRWLHGVRILESGDTVPANENALVVVNHQQMPDTMFLNMFGWTRKRQGDLKWFVKDIIKYMPGVGWGMWLNNCPFVKRNWTADAGSIEGTFARILRDRTPLWLVSFVEGTRITPAKLEAAQQYARSRGLEPLEHLLMPRTKGFVATVEGLRGHLHAVYDITLGYERGVPTLWQYVQGFARTIHMHVKRHDLADLPTDKDQLARWLIDRFVEKDRLLDRFYSTGSFS